jgi:hypothetical protein
MIVLEILGVVIGVLVCFLIVMVAVIVTLTKLEKYIDRNW